MSNNKFRYTKEFDAKYEYTGKDLGAECRGGRTVFRVWEPFAEKVELCLYREGTDCQELLQESLPEEESQRILMHPGANGTWSI